MTDEVKLQHFTVEDSLTDTSKFPPPELKGADLDFYLAKMNSPLKGLGSFILDIGFYWKINPYYILAHIILESDWGRSKIATDKNNLLGWGSYDKTPFQSSWFFRSKEGCIAIVMHKIRKNYLSPNGKFWDGSPSLQAMGVEYPPDADPDYSTDPNWAKRIVAIMNTLAVFMFAILKARADKE